jgi:ABC-type nitrate/sulfonate/bicarbonate transport system permease component
MDSMRGNDEQRLDALFRAYRDACPTPEASANFMPNLWQRIEARQTYAFSFRRMANALVTAAVAFSIVLGVYMSIPRANPYYAQTYVEVLAEANAPDTGLDLPDPGR